MHPAGSGSGGDRRGQQAAQPVQVGREQREHLLLPHAGAGLHPGVHVGDQRDRGVALPQLPGEHRLGVPGHVDQRPALGGVVERLRAGGEARTLDHDHGAADRDARVRAGDGRGEPRAVRVGEGHVHGTALDEARHPPRGAVDELVGHDHVTGRDVGSQPADGAGGEHLTHPQGAERPGVGAVVDRVRRVLVVRPVPGQEGDPASRDLAERRRAPRARRTASRRRRPRRRRGRSRSPTRR